MNFPAPSSLPRANPAPRAPDVPLVQKDQHFTVRYWLYLVCGGIILTIIIGALTRLTDSGLAITQWQPITGILPPFDDSAWQNAFRQYQQTGEYLHHNIDMNLAEFKRIYWWEWGHRLIARMVGVIYGGPFFYFLCTGRIRGKLALWLTGILLLGGLQGFVGWIMVQSGLGVDDLAVSHLKLALHLGLAVALYIGVLVTALRLHPAMAARKLQICHLLCCCVLIGMIYCQILSGALVSGLDAGLVYPSWPLMGSSFVAPEIIWGMAGFHDLATVQFWHRMLAYMLALAGIFFSVFLYRNGYRFWACLFLATIFGQITLGVLTLVTLAPIDHLWLAALHQIGALVVLTLCLKILLLP